MIDTHVHFWKFDPERDGWISEDMEVLQRDYVPEDMERIAEKFGVTGLVAVQASQSDAETEFLCSLAAHHPIIKGVVGWVDLYSEGLARKLEEYSTQKIIKGFRHILQAEEPGFMLHPHFLRGVETLGDYGYTYDILVVHNQLPEVLTFLEHLPRQKLIIDHCAKPSVLTGELVDWEKNMRAVAKHDNVFCKISGLVTEAPWHKWEKEDLYPYLDVVMDCFGADRVLYGSDWPVIYTSAFYGKWLHVLKEYMQQFSAEDQDKFFYKNAQRVYDLSI